MTNTSLSNGVHTPMGGSVAGWIMWTGFTLAISGAVAVDLAWGSKKSATGHHVRGAVISSVAWLCLGVAFAGFLTVSHGADVGFVFFTGYLVEKMLSVDNLVVIALVFRTFRIKPSLQGPVLKWGIIGAVFFRTIFIFAGVVLLEYFTCAIYVFGGLLLWSAFKMYSDMDDDSDELAKAHKQGNSWMMRCLTSIVPYDADARCQSFLRRIDGRLHATPMLAALVVVELSDLIFAIDSIPCILGLTQDLFLVFSSNMLAILGLRSLYILLAEVLEHVNGLKKGLAVILAFVGIKMMLGKRFPLPEHASLLVIFGILGATMATSALSGAKGRSVLLPL